MQYDESDPATWQNDDAFQVVAPRVGNVAGTPASVGLGKALRVLGEGERGTARLEREYTRARAPLEWATTQMNLGIAL
jgi:hypothetical protein